MKRKEIDLSRVRTVPLAERPSKVEAASLGRPHQLGGTLRQWIDRLPDVLAARDFRTAVRELAARRRDGGKILLGMGAHPIKVGLSPSIVDLIERGWLAGVAMNGAGIVHDYEMAVVGRTSEEVAEHLADGSFGMAEETGAFLNESARFGAAHDLGLGEAVGRRLIELDPPYLGCSILAAAARAEIPATVHVAVGTDIVHMHPSADGAAIGATSMRDFRVLAAAVCELERGAFINLGSAVILPEVFLKALNLARNLGHPVRDLLTLDLDFQRHYRPLTNVVSRPTALGGRGIHLTGHHEILFPLLCAALVEEIEGAG